MKQHVSLILTEEPEPVRSERDYLTSIINSSEKKQLDRRSEFNFLGKEWSIAKGILKNKNHPWKTLYRFPRAVIRFYLQSVASYIFNLYLMKRGESGYPLNRPINGEKMHNGLPIAPIVGCYTPDQFDLETDCGRIIKEIMNELDLEFNDFNLQDQKHVWTTLTESWRPLTVHWSSLKIFSGTHGTKKQKLLDRIRNTPKIADSTTIEVFLHPGTYITTFLRGIVELTVPVFA